MIIMQRNWHFIKRVDGGANNGEWVSGTVAKGKMESRVGGNGFGYSGG